MLLLGVDFLPDALPVLSSFCSSLLGLIGSGTAMIDSTTVALIVASLMGCWASGFAIGKSVAYVRRIGSVA